MTILTNPQRRAAHIRKLIGSKFILLILNSQYHLYWQHKISHFPFAKACSVFSEPCVLDQRHSPGFIESLTKAQDPRLGFPTYNRETEV
jgi:hypothetical protein